jgi:hypothetical protein
MGMQAFPPEGFLEGTVGPRRPLVPEPSVVQPPQRREHADNNYSKSSKLQKLRQLGWQAFIRSVQPPSEFVQNLHSLCHPAASLLASMQQDGVPVRLSTAATTSETDAAVERGPHQSARQHIEFLQQEFSNMERKGHWVTLPYSAVRELPNLRVSPMGVVPQRERRPRTIVDYTFSGVNADTIPEAPYEAMQFGRTLRRILQAVVYASPRHGPVFLFKLDVADGYYRVGLRPNDIPKLAVTFPAAPGDERILAFPLALPMGWVLSPPYFCAVTETITDLANARAKQNDLATETSHRLDKIADTHLPMVNTVPSEDVSTATHPPLSNAAVEHNDLATETTHCLDRIADSQLPIVTMVSSEDVSSAAQPPLTYFDVYIDDFIGAAQGDLSRLQAVRRTLFETVDQVFRPLEPSDTAFNREEPISVKKLSKGDGAWDTKKVILGWEVDTVACTIALTPHKAERIHALLAIPRSKRRMGLQRWQQFLGELLHAATAIPGARGLFSFLHDATANRESDNKVRLSRHVHDTLADFRWLLSDMVARPTHLFEWFPDRRYHIGACDASKAGMGGIWFPWGTKQPVLWRHQFPVELQNQLVSRDNPHGTVTNSDLELAATIAHLDIAARLQFSVYPTLAVLSDNTPAVAWQRRGNKTGHSVTALLLRFQSLHQRHFRYYATFDHIAGTANVMADTASRDFHVPDEALLTHFDHAFPQTRSI